MRYCIESICAQDIDEAWRQAIHVVLSKGDEVSPRGMLVKEVLGLQLRLTDLRKNVLTNPQRDLNHKFAVAEWLWMQAGLDDVETIVRYNKNIGSFSDNGSIFYGAYGPRLFKQWDYIIETLSRDPDSRQAVATIYDPCPPKTKDVPCTLSLQWFIRDNLLNCVATMRSSDLWLGLPYDIFNFTQLTNALAGHLKLGTGQFIITLGSAHLYEHNWDSANRCLMGRLTESLSSPQLHGFCSYADARYMLNNTYTPAHNVYAYYGNALACKTKAAALEVLREASKLG